MDWMEQEQERGITITSAAPRLIKTPVVLQRGTRGTQKGFLSQDCLW